MTPALSRADEPLHIEVAGVPSRAVVSLELSSTDARGVAWTSQARFRADKNGRVDLDRAAPLSGSYGGQWGSGLLVSLEPEDALAPRYAYDQHRRFAFRLRALVAGKSVGATTFERRLSTRALTHLDTTLAREGFLGFFAAQKDTRRRPAVLTFGGSEGGLSSAGLSELLAARGFPSLAVAYFGLPGLPEDLYRIELEYFVRALEWLSRRPEVDPKRIFVLGGSRGSEAALLLGVHYPSLVHGVVASVPSNAARASGWTLRGREVPSAPSFRSLAQHAAIPVERIDGQIFLNCGRNDFVWPSCNFAHAIVERLEAKRHPFEHELYESRVGGHAIGFFVPYQPTPVVGSQEDERAREEMWPRLLAFLERSS